MRQSIAAFVLASFWATVFVAAHEWKVVPWGCVVGQKVANLKAQDDWVGPLQGYGVKFHCPDESHGQAETFRPKYDWDEAGDCPKVKKRLADPVLIEKVDGMPDFSLCWNDPKGNGSLGQSPFLDVRSRDSVISRNGFFADRVWQGDFRGK